MTDTTRIVSNLRRAIEIIEAVPEDKLNLDFFRKDTSCGTLFCTAGWLTTDKQFQDQGMALLHVDEDPWRRWMLVHAKDGVLPNEPTYDWSFLDKLFGDDAFGRLFAERAAGELDAELVGDTGGDDGYQDKAWDSVTDKELALLRLRHQLALYEKELAHG